MRNLWDALRLGKLTIFTVFSANCYFLCLIERILVQNTLYLCVPFPYNVRPEILYKVWLPQPIVCVECVCLLICPSKLILPGKCIFNPLWHHLPSLKLITGTTKGVKQWLTHFYMRNSESTRSMLYTNDDIGHIL